MTNKSDTQRTDAERYRFTRDRWWLVRPANTELPFHATESYKQGVDNTVDAAIAQSEKKV
jgi:hypothetical protein